MSDKRNVIESRRAKHRRWLAAGGSYANGFRREAEARTLQADFADRDQAALEAQPELTAVAGRVMLRRVMGKASFVTLQDVSGRIQCYLTRDDLGAEAYDEVKSLWDIGDIVGVRGRLMRTNRGELTVRASEATLLNKTLRALPEKFHGLTDQETRYRQRYVDLIVNEDSRRVFEVRSRVVREIRNFFEELGFLEVETPMMHSIPGGALARPFITHHNSLDMDLYLRVAPELFLKRLVVGGFERVFEINRNFRNEGLSTRHNPEFTMLEFYWAYRDYRELMDLTVEMLRQICVNVIGGTAFSYQGEEIDFGRDFAVLSMADSLIRYTDLTEVQLADKDAIREILKKELFLRELRPEELEDADEIEIGEADWGLGKLQMELFEACVEKRLIQPTFITHYPAEVSPLSRRNDADPGVTDRFELFIAGREIANGFSELNDPDDQAGRFREQAARGDTGDHEAMRFDADYITALEYGLPPTAGEGVGIDRLVMLLTDSASIRDVLLFPLLRPQTGSAGNREDDRG
ncbi:MAG: lysine--tRNA ligase [Gammaproteobacteria bacterium]|nr:lysine--tRNA ligase [Gammaproteobacteria bacterium]